MSTVRPESQPCAFRIGAVKTAFSCGLPCLFSPGCFVELNARTSYAGRVSEKPLYHDRAWFYATLPQYNSVRALAIAFGWKPTAVHAYATRNHGFEAGRAHLTDSQKQDIKREYQQGSTVAELAEKYGCSESTVKRQVRGEAQVQTPKEELLRLLAGYIAVHQPRTYEGTIISVLKEHQDRALRDVPSADVYRRAFGSVRQAVREARAFAKAHPTEVIKPKIEALYQLPKTPQALERELKTIQKRTPEVLDIQTFPHPLKHLIEAGYRQAYLRGVRDAQKATVKEE